MVVIYKKSINNPQVLFHHGIKGQKWGVRNGPPYPLRDNPTVQAVGKSMHSLGSLSVDSRLVKTAAIVGLGALGAYGLTQMDPKDLKYAAEMAIDSYKESYYTNRKYFQLNSIPKIEGDHGLDKAVEYLPNINAENKGGSGKFNCAFCVSALVMRMKGYDVSAVGCDNAVPPDLIQQFFKDAKFENVNTPTANALFSELAKNKEGSYGSLGLYPKGAGKGHDVFWMVHEGKVRVLDPQLNKEYTLNQLTNSNVDFARTIVSNLNSSVDLTCTLY